MILKHVGWSFVVFGSILMSNFWHVHCTQVSDSGPLGPLVFHIIFNIPLYRLDAYFRMSTNFTGILNILYVSTFFSNSIDCRWECGSWERVDRPAYLAAAEGRAGIGANSHHVFAAGKMAAQPAKDECRSAHGRTGRLQASHEAGHGKYAKDILKHWSIHYKVNHK